ncbi:MAG: dienelactone hydrolase family protein [Steroidobacteraceae bacterium]
MQLLPIQYRAGDRALTGFLADGSGGRRTAGVLVAHESPGLTAHSKERAAALAALGYVAFALDLFGRHDLELDDARRLSAEVMTTPGVMYQRAHAALEVLAAQEHVDSTRLAAIGFCLGGVTVLELARHGDPLQCVIGFHPGLKRPAGSPDGPITANVLMMMGDLDPIAPQADREEFARSMTAARARWELHVFGGVGHSFTNPAIDSYGLDGFRFDAEATRRSWSLALSFLELHLQRTNDDGGGGS